MVRTSVLCDYMFTGSCTEDVGDPEISGGELRGHQTRQGRFTCTGVYHQKEIMVS